jgi:hypothetical protein
MPTVYLYIIAALGFFKDSISSILKDKKTRSVILVVLLAVLVNKQLIAQKRKDYLKGGNIAGTLAARLFEALHSLDIKLPFIGYLPDGTDEVRAYKIAAEMGKLGNINAVSEAYKLLYNLDLKTDLSSEGISERFWSSYNGTTAGAGSGSTGTGSGSTVDTWNGYFKTGQTVKVKVGYNMRNTATGIPIDSGDNSTLYVIETIYINKTVSGITGTWVLLYNKSNLYGLFKQNFYVFLSGLVNA